MKQLLISAIGFAFFAVASAPAQSGCSGRTPTSTAVSQAKETQDAPARRPPQAKSKAELDDYNAANAASDLAVVEKSATDFAAKYPASELRILLYKSAMRKAQAAGNGAKTEAFAGKVQELDTDDPEALVNLATAIVERSQAGDLDFDQQMAEATKLATRATETVDTDIVPPAGAPPAQVEAYRSFLRSSAWGILGTIAYNQNKFADAEKGLTKAIDAFPDQADPVTVVRLALALDKQEKYAAALVQADKAVALTQAGNPVGDAARSEQSRLQQLLNKKK